MLKLVIAPIHCCLPVIGKKH